MKNRTKWRTPFFIICGGLVAFPCLQVSMSRDAAGLCYYFVLAPLTMITLFVLASDSRNLSMWVAPTIFGIALYLFFQSSYGLRAWLRWAFVSKNARTEILAQPENANGAFRHQEWDGWGFAGSDTTVYLVLDPGNTLAEAAKTRSPGKYKGLPCEVDKVSRLADRWYYVIFYTDMDWDHCA